MRTNFDFAPLYRSTVGFDQFADLIDRALSKDSAANGYPPFNIEKTSDDAYRISIAAAGFSEDDMVVEVRENTLLIAANRRDEGSERTFLHRGIAQRSFEKKFQLATHVIVTGATYENGMLHVDLKRELPETLKPRRIHIGSPQDPRIRNAEIAA